MNLEEKNIKKWTILGAVNVLKYIVNIFYVGEHYLYDLLSFAYYVIYDLFYLSVDQKMSYTFHSAMRT